MQYNQQVSEFNMSQPEPVAAPAAPSLPPMDGMDPDIGGMEHPETGGLEIPGDGIDHEGAIAKADLFKLAQYSFKLFKKIQDDDQLEAWVQAKITKAADYIASVYHYLEYEMEFSEYGKKIENSEMYNESQKRELKTRLLEAREKVAELKKIKAAKLTGKKVEKVSGKKAAEAQGLKEKGKSSSAKIASPKSKIPESVIDDIKDRQEAKKKEKEEKIPTTRKVAGKSYGGSKQKDDAPTELDENLEAIKKYGVQTRAIHAAVKRMNKKAEAEETVDEETPAVGMSKKQKSKAASAMWKGAKKRAMDDETIDEDQKSTANFTAEDIKKLEVIPSLEAMKVHAMELISADSKHPMLPQKIQYFQNAIDHMSKRTQIIKLMYDLLLSGEGLATVGTRNSMARNSYQQKYNEDEVSGSEDTSGEELTELTDDELDKQALAQRKRKMALDKNSRAITAPEKKEPAKEPIKESADTTRIKAVMQRLNG